MKKVTIYTDGACSGNPGVGGWAAVLLYNGLKKEISGFEQETTNNRMELMAIIQGLRAVKDGWACEVCSDSQYVVDAFNKGWVDSWQANGWKTASKSPVKNVDLWNALLFEVARHSVQFIKVKGHAEVEYNERCDELARAAIVQCNKLQEQ